MWIVHCSRVLCLHLHPCFLIFGLKTRAAEVLPLTVYCAILIYSNMGLWRAFWSLWFAHYCLKVLCRLSYNLQCDWYLMRLWCYFGWFVWKFRTLLSYIYLALRCLESVPSAIDHCYFFLFAAVLWCSRSHIYGVSEGQWRLLPGTARPLCRQVNCRNWLLLHQEAPLKSGYHNKQKYWIEIGSAFYNGVLTWMG